MKIHYFETTREARKFVLDWYKSHPCDEWANTCIVYENHPVNVFSTNFENTCKALEKAISVMELVHAKIRLYKQDDNYGIRIGEGDINGEVLDEFTIINGANIAVVETETDEHTKSIIILKGKIATRCEQYLEKIYSDPINGKNLHGNGYGFRLMLQHGFSIKDFDDEIIEE